MITSKDLDFHPVDRKNWRWTETTPLSFSVASAGILGNLYIAARPNLGVALSSVGIVQGFHTHPYEVAFSDAQMHLPCPPNFVNYELESGLRVNVTEKPIEYHFQYEYKLGGCSFDLKFSGLHAPFDPSDANENPMLAKDAGHQYDERLGTQWGNPSNNADDPSGHFELMGHISGHLELRGIRYDVDCYDCVDHSWSQRTETSKRAVGWISAVFGKDYGIHMAMLMNVRNNKITYESLRNGFVMRDGAVYGLVSATVEGDALNFCPMRIRIVAVDVRGEKHEISGSAVAVHPWYNYNPSHVAFQSLMRWQSGARIGYSEMANIFGLEFLAERQSTGG